MSTQGNLQVLLRAYYNAPVQLSILSHKIIAQVGDDQICLSESKCESSFVSFAMNHALNWISGSSFYIIERSITLKCSTDSRLLTFDHSICLLKAPLSESSLEMQFYQGHLGIGQYFQAKNELPKFQLLSFESLQDPPSNYDSAIQPFQYSKHLFSTANNDTELKQENVILHRLFCLHNSQLFCFIDEYFFDTLDN